MIDVAAARALARRRLEARSAAWAAEVLTGAAVGPADDAGGSAGAAMSISLKPPTERQMLADEGVAEAWARDWAALGSTSPDDGIEVDWQTRSWRSIGRQRVPVRLRLRDADAVARFAGGTSAAQWSRLRDRALRLADRLGSPDALSAVVRRHARDLTAYEEERFAQVTDVTAWIVANPVAGLRPRQVPVRGVDSKWLGAHRRLVTDLVAAATGSPDLGLVDADRLIRLRVLDDALAVGGLRDLASTTAQFAGLPIAPEVVIVLENLESLLALPPWPGVVAIHGSGYAVATVGALPWVHAAPVLYWGDLDSNGFAILRHLRRSHPDVTSVLMDEPTLLAHRDLWVPEPTPVRGDIDTLTEPEIRALHALRREGDVRLEQERIPWDLALTALTDAACAHGTCCLPRAPMLT
ncbi:Wadjet anti-phage system protein JetD domain-containing protein [Agilicoccus flavus]|uniref:Wadjet anti-phage system protein JetD domain-containing protein n=1 Tax=Agilicoccus flavus TaxID=2775968 RepID=UPI001CF68319|nr:DUF3322 and DUF2220 domain-containing protein [Agilicoccus flavus]